MGTNAREEITLRQAAYQADITYGTNSAMVFDYLRDNLATDPEERVHRNQHFAIVDEVDLLLIDEVRTPLIISGPSREDSSRFVTVDKVIRKLQPGVHYRADWKTKTASLTEEGWEQTESKLNAGSLHHPDNLHLYNAVYQSVLAHCVFRKDVDYIVDQGQVQLIDEHTGRVSADKRFSDGLHQALEAKEGLRVRPEARTFARTSYLGYFRQYDNLCGMTGTASTEKEEFRTTYGMNVVVIPTNKPNIRKDYSTSVFPTMEDKHDVITNEVKELQESGRPVLVGTCNVRESEQLARAFKRAKIKCQVLNAKNHQREAEIIAQAGRKNAVTISTNMAGRGTDILLGGDPEKLAGQKAKEGTPHYKKALAKYETLCAEEKKEVVEVGGLHVIGTSLHESERLDNQLRGRAGRQGDPGSSQFIVCLEDDIFRQYGESEVEIMLDEFDDGEGDEIVNTSAIRQLMYLRDKVGIEYKFERNETFKYDLVIDEQRREIYKWRKTLLEASRNLEQATESVLDQIHHAIDDVLEEIIEDEDFSFTEEGEEQIEYALYHLFVHELDIPPLRESSDVVADLTETIFDQVVAIRETREEKAGKELLCSFEHQILLQAIDELWIDHLTAIEHLEDRVNLMGYAQLDPYVLFKTEVAKMYKMLMRHIRRKAVNLWFTIEVAKPSAKRKRNNPSKKKNKKRG
jgi:preprotein translocase subunit SecA